MREKYESLLDDIDAWEREKADRAKVGVIISRRPPPCTCQLAQDAQGYFERVPDPNCPRHRDCNLQPSVTYTKQSTNKSS
jgi:hypothetical protein